MWFVCVRESVCECVLVYTMVSESAHVIVCVCVCVCVCLYVVCLYTPGAWPCTLTLAEYKLNDDLNL